MRPPRTEAISASSAKAALTAMLMLARDPAKLSVDSLARSYRVPRGTIERMLAAEQARRAGA